jgi:hypothetical protein
MNYYTFSGKEKNFSFALMGIGLISIIYGLFSSDVSGTRFWGNILLEALFFTFISLGAVFFMSLQYVAQAGWPIVVKRIYEAIGSFMPIGLLIVLIVVVVSAIGGAKGSHDIVYHWMTRGVQIPGSENFDELLYKKKPYLNVPFVLIRTIVICGIWVYLAMQMRKRSIESDLTNDYLSLHYKNLMTAAVYIIFFGITEQMVAWDWVMSIDGNWHSTLFGWYLFDDMWLTGVIATILLTLHVKRKGLLPNVNTNHIHNLGLWTFALSVLWGYLWFFQFMFYWYTNIPDEVVYFQQRIDHYRWLFWIMFIINLLLPLIGLMTRDAKRNPRFLMGVCFIILITHWIDAYVWIMPGSIGIEWHIGIPEIGTLVGFFGMFIYVVFSALSKVPIQVKNHPYLEESIHHHV